MLGGVTRHMLPHLSAPPPLPPPCKQALNKSVVNRCEEIEKRKIGHLASTNILQESLTTVDNL